MQAKPGYVLFLLFSILSMCSVLISLYFARIVVYRQLVQQQVSTQQTTQLALSSIALAQTLLNPEKKQPDQEQTNQQPQPSMPPEAKTLLNVFPYFNKEKNISLTTVHDGFDATISLSIQSEQGKLNINSLYDFKDKKFMFEGQAGDRKKLCSWLFERIAAITGKPSLMNQFEQFLKNRSYEINDVLELMTIPEFATQFQNNMFITFQEKQTAKVFLTDIFTVYSEQETINPWLFSHSWQTILDLQIKKDLSNEDLQKILATFKTTSNWDSDWNSSFTNFYKKEYKDLAQEIKSILTTKFEANIFSLLLKAKIGETTSSIFTIVKANPKQHLACFDVIKTTQI